MTLFQKAGLAVTGLVATAGLWFVGAFKNLVPSFTPSSTTVEQVADKVAAKAQQAQAVLNRNNTSF